MKYFLFFVVSIFIPAIVFAERTCIEAKPNMPYGNRFLYLGENHWLTVVDKRLLELKNDKLVSTLAYSEPLQIMCGKKGRVIATTHQKILEWQAGKLSELQIPFKWDALASDGATVYSVDPNSNLFAFYTNKNGTSKRILEQKGLSGYMYNGQFIWNDEGHDQTLIFKNGDLISKIKNPTNAGFATVFNPLLCPKSRLYSAEYNYSTQSRFGFQTRHIAGPILNIDYPKGCDEFVFLLNDLSLAKGALWSLKPGKELTFTHIPTACPVDHFASNEDGSLFYRCGKQLYYKDKARTKDVQLGAATKLQLTEGLNDQWLATPRDGTLLAYLPRSKDELEKVCFVRLAPTKLVDIGCY